MSTQIEVVLVGGGDSPGGTGSQTLAPGTARATERAGSLPVSGRQPTPAQAGSAESARAAPPGRRGALPRPTEATLQAGRGDPDRLLRDLASLINRRESAREPVARQPGSTSDRIKHTGSRWPDNGPKEMPVQRRKSETDQETGRQEDAPELPEEAPKRDDFRDLAGSLSDLANRWSPRSVIDAIRRVLSGNGDRPRDVHERVESHTSSDRRDRYRERTAGDTSRVEHRTSSDRSRTTERIRESIRERSDQFRASASRLVERFADTRAGRSRVGRSVGRVVGGVRAAGGRFGAGTAARAATGGAARTAAGAMASSAAGSASAGTASSGGAVAALGGLAAALGVVVGALALLGAIAVATVKKFKSLGDELEDISAPIAAARAGADIEREYSRIERAERIGGAVANVDSARGRLEDAGYDVMTSIYDTLANGLAPTVELGMDTLTMMVRYVEALKEGMDIMTSTSLSPAERKKQYDESKEAQKKLYEAVKEWKTFNGPPEGAGMDRFMRDLAKSHPDQRGRIEPNGGP